MLTRSLKKWWRVCRKILSTQALQMCCRNIPLKNTVTIDVHTGCVASDELIFYMDTTKDTWGKNAAMQLLDQIFQDLPNTRDNKKYSLISEFDKSNA